VSSARRSPVTLLLLFVVPFAVAAVGAFVLRTNQLEASAPTDPVVVVETSVPVETIPALTVETTAVAETTVAATTEAPVETTTTSTEAPVPVAPDAPISTEGALLRPLDNADRRLFDPAADCASLSRDGSALRACEISAAGGIEIAWVSMDEGVDVLTRRPDEGPDVWTVVLRSSASSSRSPVFADVTGDGEADLVVGWRSDGVLAADVVEVRSGAPSVTLHLSLLDGRIAIGDGQLDAWSKLDDGFARWTYSGGGDSWEATSALDNDPPSGQL
jgi:hypothetical protein